MSGFQPIVQEIFKQARLDPKRAKVHVFPARDANFDPSPDLISPLIRDVIAQNGIHHLYTHQAATIRAFNSGCNILLATPTASGKSLCYQIPTVQMILRDPTSCALYLFPFKALAQDQAQSLAQWMDRIPMLASRPLIRIHDGDTSQDQRRKTLTAPPSVLITNPDILHYSILPNHASWHEFLKNIQLIVVDELHIYKGIFGSHVLQIFRRLNRVLEHYQSKPKYIACSATIGNPLELIRKLTGLPFELVDVSGAPVRSKVFVSYLPEGQASTEATRLFESTLNLGLKTIVFTKSRRSTELIYRIFQDRNRNLSERVSVYRAGFLPEERRDIEARLFRDELDGVISTSALELGIDVGGLDCCIMVGFPGSLASMWQRSGRVGRTHRPSAVFFIAGEDALDQYWYHHENELMAAAVEKAVVYEDNDLITDAHLQCAADELPLHPGCNFPQNEHILSRIESLCQRGDLLQSMDGSMFLSRNRRPQRAISIRSAGENYRIEIDEKKPIGTIDGIRVFKECHEGAIYLHGGRVYRVSELDRENYKVKVEPGPEDVFTQAYSEKQTEILGIDGTSSLPLGSLTWGRLRVHERITGYALKRILTGDIINRQNLDYPEIVFETRGLWMTFETRLIEAVQRDGHHPMGGLHGLEHAMIGLYPLISLCDRSDLAGISTRHHAQTGSAAVFIYDGFPGGLGLAESARDEFSSLLAHTLKTVAQCGCESGCPRCIQSPKCGSGNVPLDKQATMYLLEGLSGKREVPMQESGSIQASLPLDRQPVSGETDETAENTTLVFDLETQLSADEVGGWRHADKMRVALAVIYDVDNDRYETFLEPDTERLIRRLTRARLVVGFNTERFDFKVLSGYCKDRLPPIRSLDILASIESQLGHRLSLNQVAAGTLDILKSADGLQSLVWWKEGRLDMIEEYCRKDVEITWRVYDFGLKNGYLLYPHHSGMKARIPVQWGKPT